MSAEPADDGVQERVSGKERDSFACCRFKGGGRVVGLRLFLRCRGKRAHGGDVCEFAVACVCEGSDERVCRSLLIVRRGWCWMLLC